MDEEKKERLEETLLQSLKSLVLSGAGRPVVGAGMAAVSGGLRACSQRQGKGSNYLIFPKKIKKKKKKKKPYLKKKSDDRGYLRKKI